MRFSSFIFTLLVGIIILPIGFGFAVLLTPFVWAQGGAPRAVVTPNITRLWPESGGVGQYVTLEGSAFGFEPGSVVFTQRGEQVTADVDFPSQCQNYWWRDSYVIVRVPNSLKPGQYKLKLKKPDGSTTNEISYLVTTASPTPGVCAVITDNGPAGIPIKIYGEGFGKTRGRVTLGNADLAVKDGDWSDTFITATTPATGLTSGRLVVLTASKNLSNRAFFTAGRCSVASCGGGQACCQDGTCRPNGSCEDRPRLCTYGWSFSTGTFLTDGAACTKNDECSSGQCVSGKCSRGIKKEGESCRFDGECQKNFWCNAGLCASPYRTVGQACKDNTECSSLSCIKNICARGTKPVAAQCTYSDQCSSGNCKNGICGQSPRSLKIDHIGVDSDPAPRNSAPSITFNQLIDPTSLPGCVSMSPSVAGNWVFYTEGVGDDAKTVAQLRTNAPFSSSTNYQLSVDDNCVKPINDDTSNEGSGSSDTFKTGSSFATIDSLRLFVDGEEKSRDLFSSRSASHVYRVELLSGTTIINPDDAAITVSWGSSGGVTSLKPSSSGKKDEQIATALSKVGEGEISVTVTQSYLERGETRTKTLSLSLGIEVDFCPNVWDYRDNTYNFDWSYCWDPGTTNAIKLPVLKQTPERVSRTGMFEVEYIFGFTPESKNDDVISLRVVKNDEGYAPLLWYTTKGPGSGSTRPMLLDDFWGIRDDQGGAYVNTVVTGGKNYLLFMTTNREASKETRAVFDQLVQRIHLANHIADINLAKALRRDVLRVADINDIASFLDRYATNLCLDKNAGTCPAGSSKEYPKLDAGSYIKNQTISAWPSWQGTLGNVLGAALPIDPYPGLSGVSCVKSTSGAQVCDCPSPYDSQTCYASSKTPAFYYGTVEQAIDNTKVHAYSYTAKEDGTSYRLCSHLEHPELLSVTGLSGAKYCKQP